MANKIKKQGNPRIDEALTASAAITPGDLVEVHVGAGRQYRRHATANGNAVRSFALERDEAGKDLEFAYAANDKVKVGLFQSGDELDARIASGETVTGIEFLSSDGSGALQVVDASAATTEAQRAGIVAQSAQDSGGALGAITLLKIRVV